MNTVTSSIFRAWGTYDGRRSLQAADPGQVWVSPGQLYDLLKLYYLNNGLYNSMMRALFELETWSEGMKPLRNPAFRVVEFYVAHVWHGPLPNALPIVADNKKIVEPIQQIWEWSNWAVNKQLAIRWFALYGDLVIKVVNTPEKDRVYFQMIEPQYVTEFRLDERGFVTFIRLDLPQVEKNDKGESKAKTYTEVWDKAAGTFRVWVHDKGAHEPLEKLGKPKEVKKFDEIGVSFVPFVYTKFRDIGEQRGMGAFAHALDKIDEANRMATRLHQLLFRHNQVSWAVSAGGMDPTGRPLPAPRIGNSAEAGDDGVINVGDEQMYQLPGNSTLHALVPDIKYAEALAVLNAHMTELEKDLPELAYYQIREMGEISGVAVELLLSDAIDRVLEARGNAETALARADAMALTMAANFELEGFQDIGNFDDSDPKNNFEHTFAERAAIKPSDKERAEQAKAWVDAGVPLVTALRRAGWSEEEIKQMLADKKVEKKESQANLAAALLAAQRQMDRDGADDEEGEPPLAPVPAGSNGAGGA